MSGSSAARPGPWLAASLLLGAWGCEGPTAHLPARAFMVSEAAITLEVGEDGAAGLDLDGVTSDGHLQAGEPGCAHTDFVGLAGEPGIDAQLAVLGGVIGLFGFGDINAVLQQTINDGGLSILVELDELESLVRDRHVVVRVFRGEGPLALGTNGRPEPGQSFDLIGTSEPGVGSGSIEDGVLTFGGIDTLTLPLRFAMTRGDVRLTQVQGRVRLEADGTVRGVLGGVVPVEDIQALVVQAIVDGGGTGDSTLLPILERALRGVADADLDPDTQRCTGITAGIRVEAVEAFILRDGADAGVP